MTKEEFKAFVSMAYDGREHWEQFLERVWQLHVENCPSWVSVEDELPPYGQQVLVYSERDPWAERWWSERYKEYVAKFGKSGEYLILLDRNGFATLRDDDNEAIQVTHWMLVEPPEKLSNLERNGKKWKEKNMENND